jgi:DNA-binding IclR family transcriptional regulator
MPNGSGQQPSASELKANSMRTVERALKLIKALSNAPDGITLTAAAREVDLPTSTTARLLRTLEANAFAWRDANGSYFPGTGLLQAGAAALSEFALLRHAEMHLQQVADIAGETAYLAVPAGAARALYLKQVESTRAIRHAAWAGREIETAGTALGRALALQVNAAGYAVSRATAIEPDAAAAAAPIRDSRGQVVAAISLIGPSFRIDDERLNELGHLLAQHGKEMSTEIGWRG